MSAGPDDSLPVLERPVPSATEQIYYGPDEQQFGDLWLPEGEGPHPIVVNIHGGFWRARYNLEHAGHQCAALAEAGIATWNVEYRRVGNPGGGWPGTLLDVAEGADHLLALAARYPLDLERVVAMGHSAGGHLALWLAARPRLATTSPLHSAAPLNVRAVIALAAVSDLRWAATQRLSDDGKATEQFMGGAPDEYPERYADASPYDLLPLGVPQVLVHGTEDRAVPIVMSERYLRRARALGDEVALLTLPGAGHFEVIDPLTHEWGKIRSVILRLLD